MQADKLMKVLAKLEPSTKLRFWHLERPVSSKEMIEEFKFKDGEYCISTYSLINEGVDEGVASFQLKLEDQSAFDTTGVEFDPLDRIFPHPGDPM